MRYCSPTAADWRRDAWAASRGFSAATTRGRMPLIADGPPAGNAPDGMPDPWPPGMAAGGGYPPGAKPGGDIIVVGPGCCG